MLSKMRITAFFFVVTIFCAQVRLASAEESVLFSSLEVPFAPKRAFFIVQYDEGELFISQAEVKQFNLDDKATQNVWYASAIVAPPADIKNISYSLILEGDDKSSRDMVHTLDLSVKPGLSASEDLKITLDTDRMKNQLLRRELQNQDVILSHLRATVDSVGDIARIVVLREERERIEAQLHSLDQEKKTLATSLKELRERGTPENYVRRELQLTKALSDLYSLTQKETSVRASQERGVEQATKKKLKAIEMTKKIKLEDLQSELDALHRRKMTLEGKA